MEEFQEDEAVGTEVIRPDRVLEELLKSEESAREKEQESIMPVHAAKKRLFVFDELLRPSILGRYLSKPHMEMIVKLVGFRLCFPKYFAPRKTGLASIERTNDSNDIVWGVTIDITNQDLTDLNRYKGAPDRYYLKSIWIKDRGDLRYPAVCYVVTVPDKEPSRPSKELLDDIVQGAIERMLPTEYVHFLRSIPVL